LFFALNWRRATSACKDSERTANAIAGTGVKCPSRVMNRLLRLHFDVLDSNHLLPTLGGHSVFVCLPRAACTTTVALPLVAVTAVDPEREIRLGISPRD
jgi:hypothetical protein